MKINQNISAVIVNDKLLRNENTLSSSVERLSSGLKFNDAKDNPSGMAISFKMQAQINALNRASANTTDGASMVQTIDGSIGEMTEVMQRMRELCVQAANDTNQLEDLEAIQKEIEQLKKEIDRISTDTEFNGKKLLDGSLDRRTYVTAPDTSAGAAAGAEISMFDKITNVIISDEVEAGDYRVVIDKAPEHAVLVMSGGGTGGAAVISAAQAGKVSINGSVAEIKEGMTAGEVYEAIRNAGELGRVNVFATNAGPGTVPVINEESLDRQGYDEKTYGYIGDRLAFVSEEYGSEAQIEITCDNENLKNLLFGAGAPVVNKSGVDAGASVVDGSGALYGEYSGQIVVKTSGDQVVITDKSGFQMSFEVRADIDLTAGDMELTIKATDIGTLQLQVGANEDQEIAVRVPILNTKSLYIDDLDVRKVEGGDRGIAQMDTAISIVSAARAKMGAYENRLDYAQKSLDETSENMTAAISRLGDVDMAEEMTTYTNATVLTQASISVLAQANDLPQQVLSLLQG